MRKQTKFWTTKDGRRVRICDMEDSHLVNTAKMLKRLEKEKIQEGYKALCYLHSEMAIDSMERILMRVEEFGLFYEEVHPLYENILNEAIRRGIEVL